MPGKVDILVFIFILGVHGLFQGYGMITIVKKIVAFVKNEFKKRYKLDWLQPIGFNNAYALMMRKKQAEEKHITTISDLARVVVEGK